MFPAKMAMLSDKITLFPLYGKHLSVRLLKMLTPGCLKSSAVVLFFIILNIAILDQLSRRLSEQIVDTMKHANGAVKNITCSHNKHGVHHTDNVSNSKSDTRNVIEDKHYNVHNILTGSDEDPKQIISLEEDGRFGNLLLETATLILIGKRHNLTVNLLPQVAAKMSPFFSRLPLSLIDNTKHCICRFCHDCICTKCNKWRKIDSWKFNKSPAHFPDKYVLLRWYDANMILNSLSTVASIYRGNLNEAAVKKVQQYLQGLKKPGHTLVSIHVRRTDYVQFVEKQYLGHAVGANFFIWCMNQFRLNFNAVVFLVTSDDIGWCRDNLSAPDVVFPDMEARDTKEAIVNDFILLSQVNHSIYDYGSFGFWGAVMAGGKVLVADGYSARPHPILRALKRIRPLGWMFVNIQKINITMNSYSDEKLYSDEIGLLG